MTHRFSKADFLHHLARIQDKDQASIRRIVDRDTLFREIRGAIPDLEPEEPSISFEKVRSSFTDGVFFQGLRIVYKQISGHFIVERILPADMIRRIVGIHNGGVRERLTSRLLGLTGLQFEKGVVELLGGLPWILEVKQTSLRKDGGVDFLCSYAGEGIGRLRAVGQVKKTKKPTTAPELREFLGSIRVNQPGALGIYVSFGGYTKDAIRTSEVIDELKVFDLDDVITWMVENSIGLRDIQLSLTEFDEVYWEEIENGD